MTHPWKAVIGTLAHNRDFTAREITEYTRFDRQLDGRSVVRSLIKLGYLKPSPQRGHYFPTRAGWAWIDGE